MKLLGKIEGSKGKIGFYGDKIMIIREGVFSYKPKTKEILLKEIKNIQFKEAGFLTDGFIRFCLVGTPENKISFYKAIRDENTVIFTKTEQENFKKFEAYLKKHLKTLVVHPAKNQT